ncbi:MAG: hypothetical protein AAB278_00815 [Pseudomonadota bacterium]
MTIVMNMSGYEFEGSNETVEEYGDDVLCSGWNPQLALVSESAANQTDKHLNFPAELAEADIEKFLHKMYTFQR